MLFELNPVPVAELPDGVAGWLPVNTTVNGQQRVVMVRVDRAGAWAATVERVAVTHQCPNAPARASGAATGS